VAGVNLYETLHACREHLERYGGHAGAAGLTVRADRVDALRVELGGVVRDQLRAAGARATTREAQVVDAEIDLDEVSERLAEELARLGPFGGGNPPPVLGCRRVLVKSSRPVGADRSHLELRLESGAGQVRRGIAFGAAKQDPGAGATIDVAFVPEINEWRGARRVDMKIKALAPS